MQIFLQTLLCKCYLIHRFGAPAHGHICSPINLQYKMIKSVPLPFKDISPYTTKIIMAECTVQDGCQNFKRMLFFLKRH